MYVCDNYGVPEARFYEGVTDCSGTISETQYANSSSFSAVCSGTPCDYAKIVFYDEDDCAKDGDYFEDYHMEDCWDWGNFTVYDTCTDNSVSQSFHEGDMCDGELLDEYSIETGCNVTYTDIVFCSDANQFSIFPLFVAVFAGLSLLFL